ncbi:hypothetical protein EJB05_02661, partial [Eragrostis curvula]
MAERRYYPCSSHGFFLPVLLAFLSLLFFLDLAPAVAAQPPPLNSTTQLSIMRNLSGLVSAQSSKWDTSDPNPCRWSGIVCSVSDSVVTGITLSDYGVSNSSIFAIICSLDTLQTLDLSKNALTQLSDQFILSSCAIKESLQWLNLSSNHLDGSLGVLSGFHRLEVLDLSFNFFSGRLNLEFSDFTHLKKLNLSSNKLIGSMPTRVGSSLEALVLSDNQLVGSFPVDLFACRNLTTLDLSQNNLTGHILDNFTQLPKLHTLILSGNKLSGTIPKSLSQVTTLFRFSANQNNFSGRIPSGITKHLNMLDLSYNKITGEIPSDLFSSQNLGTIDLTSNLLEGHIPVNFSHSLYHLRLGTNKLSGSIPDSIGNASNLAYLELDTNNLEGYIPSNLGKCKKLTLLSLASNNLQGQVPGEIGDLKNLVILKLQWNNISGPIPVRVSLLTNLNTLNLSHNSFAGVIPDEITMLPKLSSMNLQANNINGVIPSSISSLKNLIELNLGNNLLTGSIPAMPTSLSTALNLSHNYLSGVIPSNIGSLLELEILDLSYNNLSGEVPSSLGYLNSLTELVLSYNQLSGSLPTLPPNVLVNITGNLGLTNTNGMRISHSDRVKSKKLAAFFGVLFGLCLAAVIAMFISCYCKIQLLIIIDGCKRIYGVENEQSSVEEGAAQINNGRRTAMNSIHTSAIECMRAKRDDWQITPFQALDFDDVSIAQGLIEENLIGHGGSGRVYRVTYTNKYNSSTSVVAVKQIQCAGRLDKRLEREFESEVEMLGNIRHNNIVKLQCCISGAMSKFLVYDYMENGSLDNWVHGHALFVGYTMARVRSIACSPLDWPTRLRVAVGAAQGLFYMHHECSPPIIHRDVKTSNILLDSEFQAKVADFGLARMLVQEGEPDTMSAVAGSFGYMAPEYAYTKKVNEKVDVYSFGVVLLELTTGKKANDGGEHGCLAQWAWHHYQAGASVCDATDKCIRYAGYPGEIETVFRLGIQCTGKSPSSRPTMKDVLQILLKCSKQTDQKTREERAVEHEAAPLFLPQRGSRGRWFSSSKGIFIEEKIDVHCIA